MYSNPSVYEQSVHEFSLVRDAQINTCFSIYEPIFAYTSSFLSQTDRCSRRLFSGSNGKFIYVWRVFAKRAVLEERIKLVNREIPVLCSESCFNISFSCASFATQEGIRDTFFLFVKGTLTHNYHFRIPSWVLKLGPEEQIYGEGSAHNNSS
jgi:hypothetical protein